MRTTKTTHVITRAALVLIVMLMMTLTASATDFITDVMVVGNKNKTEFNALISSLVSAGWTDIDKDLNENCGSNSAYIHLLYKTQSSTGNTGTPITGFYIRTGSNPPDELTFEGHTYYLAPCQGSDTFVSGHGDLNSGCGGNSAYIFLYYTKDVMSDNTGVTSIAFNATQSGAVGENGGSTGYDLNSGGGGAYIYMHLTTAAGGNVVTLTSGSGDVQLLNGHILTGTGGTDTRVKITDGATVTFNGVTVTATTNNSSHSWPGIHCSGNATIVLNGSSTNSVQGGYRSPGIYVAANKTLTIQGNGTLTATGRDYAAGIGSGQSQSSCGNITISGGTITANGGQNASGIGSGTEQQSCGNITISGGTVNATGLTWAAGIGSGNQSSCGTITISGGTVTATGGLYAAAIGSGYSNASCGTITITNDVTRVTATRHNNSTYSVGAGKNSSCGTVTIGNVQTGYITMSSFVTYPYTVRFDKNGGTGTMANQALMNNVAQNLTANAFTSAGRGFLGWATSPTGPKAYNDEQSVSTMTQTSGATVTLYAKWSKTVTLASDIGQVLLQDGDTLTGTGGSNTRVKIADGATVIFSSVNNTAIANNSNHSWPGIHCLGNTTIVLKGSTTNSVKGGYHSCGIYIPQGKTLIVQGSGTLNVTGGDVSAGIGSGQNQSSCGNITISGGTITANGGQNASGIGSGHQSSCGNITISGGTVNANGLAYAAGIGSGYQSSCGDITISGGTVTATGGARAAAIGSGYENASCGDITITRGVTRVTATKQLSDNSVGAGDSSTCGTITIGGVQTGYITMNSFVTYPYTVHFDANGGTGTMTNQAFMYNVAQSLTGNAFTKEGWQFQGWATSINGSTVYNNEQSVSNLTDTSGATVTLYAKWMPDPEHLSIDGNTYTIHSTTGWDVFCNLLAENNNGYFTGKTVKLDHNIEVTTMAGSSGHEFSGVFDGQSDTLAVNYQNINGAVYTAPFSYVNGATIRNLIVAGSIIGTGHCAGIVGETGSSQSHITNCVSNVNVSGGNTAGISMGGNVEITGCVFNGKINGTSMSGGFVGSSNSALVISNSLFAPQANSSISGGTFYYDDETCEMTLVNSYYTVPLGTSQGKQARSIVGGEHVTVAFRGQATAYNTSGISAHSVGIVYGSTLYAGYGDMVSLNLSCTPPSDYVFNGYTPSAGTLTGTSNPYTLTMPDEAVTIQAVFEQLTPVTYIDGNGMAQQCTAYTIVTNNLDFDNLPAGWYVVSNSITLDRPVYFSGDAHLILCDGATMNISNETDVAFETNDSLTLYGQSGGTGSLTATSNTAQSIKADALTINGCIVNATSSDCNTSISIGIEASNLTINGSTITAIGCECGIEASTLTINSSTVTTTGTLYDGIRTQNLIINGGTVNANDCYNHGISADYLIINGGTVTTNKIYSPKVTLGWSATTDRITVGSFSYSSTPTISIKSGQAFYYIGEDNEDKQVMDTVVVSGRLTTEEIAAIGGKTLAPYTLPSVAYVDGNGMEHTCSYYTVLTGGGNTTLTEGWYVVDQNITYNGILSLDGDVNLILGNDKTMTIRTNDEGDGGIEQSSNNYDTGNLTVYGQSLIPDEAGTLNSTPNRFPQFESGFNVDNGTPTGSWHSINVSKYTQHSGNVIAGAEFDKAISADSFVINGGSINATSSDYGIFTNGDMTINGGSINATSSDYGIFTNGNITINNGSVNTSSDYSIFTNGNITINGGNVITGVGSGQAISADSFVINGGSINATGNYSGIVTDGDMTINGGSIKVNCKDLGILTKGDMTINGGDVTASVNPPFGLWCGLSCQNNIIINGGKVESDGIYTTNNIILGFTKVSDHIHANYYTANEGTVSVKNGQALYYKDGNETVIISGTLGSEQISAIGGKTLRPYFPPVIQTTDLAEGWNWFSSFIDTGDPAELLLMLEESLDENGVQIKNADYYTAYEDEEWFGDLDDEGLFNEQMYKILVGTDCTVVIEGPLANPEGHPITIEEGWNWIGFPVGQVTAIEEAMADFEAEEGDVIKNSEDYTSFEDGEWFGDIEEMEPGQGYMYFSNVSDSKILIYRSAAKIR